MGEVNAQVMSVVVGVIVHVAPDVMSIEVVSVVPCAVKLAEDEPLTETVAVVGVTAMAVMPLRKTVAVAVAVKPCARAVTVVVPRETPLGTPVEESMARTFVEKLDHVTPEVSCLLLPLLSVAQTWSGDWSGVLRATKGAEG